MLILSKEENHTVIRWTITQLLFLCSLFSDLKYIIKAKLHKGEVKDQD